MPNFSQVVDDIKQIIDAGRNAAYAAVDATMIATYWNIGRRIVEEEQDGQERAQYGKELIKTLAKELTHAYGNGYSQRYLAYFRKFYLTMPNLAILQTRLQNLKWSHILATLRVEDETARKWYLESASQQMWSVRTLSRNIATQYYERHYIQPSLPSENEPIPQKEEILKTPMMAEFLGFRPDESFSERDLESSIITHLRDFMMELGQGFAFVARQQHIHTDAEEYFIDLVFYNVILKCYILVDLKVGKITHQDVGQMDMYVRMYDELKRTEGDNPTIGIVLCSETDKDIARYSILKGNEQLFATKYKLYLPTEEQLRKEIERQKDLFLIHLEGEGIEAYVKYNMFHAEARRKHRDNAFLSPNMYYNAERDFYVCPMGQHLERCGTRTSVSELGYRSCVAVYRAARCAGCPLRCLCYKGKSERRVMEVNHRANALKRQARELLTGERGLMYRSRRPIEPEAVFGDIKFNHGFKRFCLKSNRKVKVEFGLVALAHNLRKYSALLSGRTAALSPAFATA